MKTYQVLWRLFKMNKLFKRISVESVIRLTDEIHIAIFREDASPVKERFKKIVEYKGGTKPEIRKVVEKGFDQTELDQLARPLASGGPLRFPPSPIIPLQDAYFQRGGVSIAPQEPVEAFGCDCRMSDSAARESECHCTPPLDNEDIESLKRMDSEDVIDYDAILEDLEFVPKKKSLPKKSAKKNVITKRKRKKE